MLELKNISKSYGDQLILNDVSFQVKEKELISILGPSGSGKSTLLQIIGLLNTADSGSILLDNVECTTLQENELIAFRNKKLGFVFQFHNLLGEFTCEENIKMPLFIREKTLNNDQIELFDKIINKLSISDLMKKHPNQLSGGEQQRVAVARALINQPKILLADEPTGNLDEQTRDEIMDLLEAQAAENDITLIVVTHDSAVAKRAGRRLNIKDGVVREVN
jgi:lipoprotein-releasing system ATP-binding protein